MLVVYGSMKIVMGNSGEKDPGISTLEFKWNAKDKKLHHLEFSLDSRRIKPLSDPSQPLLSFCW